MRIHLLVAAFFLTVLYVKADYCSASRSISLSEYSVDSQITNVRWINNSNVIFVITKTGTLYRSGDGGNTWTNELSKLQNSQVPVMPYNRTGIQNIIQHRNSSGTIYFFGWGSNMWITQDNGQTYSPRIASVVFDTTSAVDLHPTRLNWILRDGPSPRCLNASQPGGCFRILYLTQDGGISWRQLDTYVYQFAWGNAGLYGVNEKNIWVLDWATKTGDQMTKSVYSLQIIRSVDFLQTRIDVPLHNVIFMLHHSMYTFFATRNATSPTMKLYVSTDSGRSYVLARFPLQFTEQQYLIIDDSEGSVFIGVKHNGASWVNVYHSDTLGGDYELSLPYVIRDPYTSFPQFRRVNGLNGIYLANQAQNVVGNGNGNGAKSMITYDEGGEWSHLPLPEDTFGNPIPCNDPNCQLNLYINRKITNGNQPNGAIIGPLLSHSSAIGLVTATGNMGATLNLNNANLNTYFTRDAGWTWNQIATGSNIYEYADHGALTLLVDLTDATNTLAYTWNEGLSFESCQFTYGSNVEIENIIVHPNSISQAFLLQGYRSNADGSRTGVLVNVDFTNFHQRQCVDSDYELWSPSDSRNGSYSSDCILGQQVAYKRRKRTAECYNGDEYEVETIQRSCPCTREDYECDYCYQENGNFCEQVPGCDAGVPPCVDGYQSFSLGYRLIAGDKCVVENGLNLLPKKTACSVSSSSTGSVVSSSSSNHSHRGLAAGIVVLIVLIVIGVIAAILGGLFYLNRKNRYLQFRPLGGYDDSGSTALDEDLLQSRDAEPIDEEEIARNLNSTK